MSIQASSLERLYNQGILNYVPYDLCQPMSFAQNNNMNYGNQYGQMMQSYNSPMNNPLSQKYASPYMQQAEKGKIYPTYNGDTFIRRNLNEQNNEYSFKRDAFGVNDGIGVNADYKSQIFNNDSKNFRQQIMEEANVTNNSVTGKNDKKTVGSFWKGLLAGGIIIGTLVYILKGKKPPKP